MKLTLLICGKLKAGPEADMARDYILRASRTGKALGFSEIAIREIPVKSAQSAQAVSKNVLDGLNPDTKCLVLDERGKDMGSKDFAQMLAGFRDDGVRETCLMIGPADGWDKSVRSRADKVLSFGKWTWPHKLVHAMAAEQIYRTTSLLAGTPYHRGGA